MITSRAFDLIKIYELYEIYLWLAMNASFEVKSSVTAEYHQAIITFGFVWVESFCISFSSPTATLSLSNNISTKCHIYKHFQQNDPIHIGLKKALSCWIDVSILIIYFHILSFLKTVKAQLIEIFPYVRQGHIYPARSQGISSHILT